MSQSKGASTFIKGTAILGISAIIVKVLSAIFRIPLANIIGDDGMGYFQTAYPIYNLILVVSTAGIPTAIAKIIAGRMAIGDVEGADRVFKVTFRLMVAAGFVIMLLLLLCAKPMVQYLNNEKAYWAVVAIAPAIFFISMTECYRGYFQGCQQMQAFAASQVTEQFVRVITGFTLAILLLGMGKEFAAAGATFGATMGCMAGFGVILILYSKFRKKANLQSYGTHAKETVGEIIKTLLIIAIPITLGASILPVFSMLDLAIVFRRLADVGFTPEQANALYGQLTGFALTLVNLPQVMTAAIQISIVPAVAHLVAIKDKITTNHTIETGLRLSLIIGLPTALGLSLLSEDIMRLLYPMQTEIATSTGHLLYIFGYSIVPLAVYQVTTGILQGLHKQEVPAYNLLVGAVFKVVLTFVLVGMPALNIQGAAWSTVIALTISALLNFFSVLKYTDLKLDYSKLIIKPLIAVAAMGVAVVAAHMGLQMFLKGSIATALAIMVGGLVYTVMLFVTKTISNEDMELMPGGAKIMKIKAKLGLK